MTTRLDAPPTRSVAIRQSSVYSSFTLFRRINGTYFRTMRETTQNQRVLDLLAQKGMLRPIDLDAIGIPRVVLTRMSTASKLEKIGRRLYHVPSLGSENESLVAIATRVPQAVFCLLTALQFHELDRK